MRIKADPEAVLGVGSDNCLEISCRECTRNARKEMQAAGLDSTSFRIIHRFAFDGVLVESVREAL